MLATLEKIIRKKLNEVQGYYGHLPVFAQNLAVTARGYILSKMRYNTIFWKTLDRLRKHDNFTYEQMIYYQNQRLRETIAFAYQKTPYYHRVMAEAGLSPEDIQCIDDLKKMPILTRDDIRRYFRDLLVKDRAENQRIIVYTSGTSGSGIPIAYDAETLAKQWAFLARQGLWAGVDPRDWRVTMFGSKIVPETQNKPPFWRYNLFEKEILLSIFHLSEYNKKAYLHFLHKHEGKILDGFASVLGIIADMILQENDCIPMKIVRSTGEPLSQSYRRKIERAFNCQVYDNYGMTEWVGLIQECERGGMHLISDFGVLEILDENNNPVPPGVEGYFVWTGLIRKEMPLIRYKIGDKGMWKKNQFCPCGRPYPLVDPTITRDSDILKTPDGKLFSPRVINQFLKDKVSFKTCQFIQEDSRRVIVRIVPGKGTYELDARRLVKDLISVIGTSMLFSIEYAKEPIKRDSGKIPLIINKSN
ncbi:MAG: hypothetical protein B5M53_02200 [Candidatus Cloacimonas sp. 4484_209]|nr:MAG: hypothetical protein B5M53_02200 [Candidatus Cloacimonas sp. 4484_209]